ncbi:aminoglycoside phosphotransferase [Paenibacillus sp. FSL H7-0357]|uniref:phosphotransferase enzyme family protein n=1 Tax=Paenibacillus sp. FSL H7-0357 TaxID=1536774 RepID=UPI0004F700E8|nr:phosphotransferase [Paenibacillus sp. FSL H7-0357]AIQ17375.1 aminoglycoside phosphotransferase [Paenibacillus sp. FSL H7-0357]
MFEAFRCDTDEDRRLLLKQARSIVMWALPQYGLDWTAISYIGLSDNITYKIETASTGSYLLRMHGRWMSNAEIQSELLLLQALNRVEGLTMPEGVANTAGTYILKADSEEDTSSLWVTVTRWVEGEHAGGHMTDQRIFDMGAMTGALHIAAAGFAPPAGFIRPVWGEQSFKREMDKLGRYYSGFVSETGWKTYQLAAAKILSELEGMEVNEDQYGLIHGDLHSGNVVFAGEQPYPIDFGRCGYGYYLYDLAAALLELSPGQRKRLIEGYASRKKLESGYVRRLECFFIMIMIGNYSHHASNPAEVPGLREQQPYSQAYLREYLKSAPFLFEVIEPEEMK